MGERWFTSPLNFADEVRRSFRFASRIRLHDVTLRDGEQQAGIVFSTDDKIRIAERLAEVGVHRIEAGLPSVSPADEAAIRAIVRRNLPAEIFAFSRCMIEDVKRAVDCGVRGVVMEIPSSEHIIKYAYQWPLERAIELSVQATRYAREQGLYVVFFPIDATRADPTWFMNLIGQVARDGHMDSLVLVDTFGGTSPHGIAHFVEQLRARFDTPLEAHFHNDFGMGVANTLTALSLGVDVAHVTVSSLGERAGNAALEEVALALLTMYGQDLDLRYEQLTELSALVQELSGTALPPNAPVVGRRLFDIESGIIASWLVHTGATRPLELFPFHWDLVGQHAPQIVLGKGSGRDSVLFHLRRLGIEVSDGDPRVDELLADVKRASLAKKGLLSDTEFRGMVDRLWQAAVPSSPGGS